MRCITLVLLVGTLGCAKGIDMPSVTEVVASPPYDPAVAIYEAHTEAAFDLDAACASMEEARKETVQLALSTGDEAREALIGIVQIIDSAGERLGDAGEEPPALEDYRKDLPGQAKEREEAVDAATEAAHDLQEAQVVLKDLAANVPPEHAKALAAIRDLVDEAEASAQDAIDRLTEGQSP